MSEKMKAITYYEYGSPKNMQLEELDRPTPKGNEVLVNVRAASINSWDWDLVKGEPFYVRLVGGGLRKPIKKIIGCDIAGIVHQVGDKVTGFKVGDEVVGDISTSGWGGFAEFVCAKEKVMIHKPSNLSFEEAASLPQAGVMALQAATDFKKINAGDKVLINGAGGGVGSLAIQLIKELGAEITGVDRSSKFEHMKSLGADYVIDFTVEDFTQKPERYDYIIDVVGHHSLYDFKHALKPGGEYRMIGGPGKLILQAMFIAPFISLFTNKKMGILGHEPNKRLDYLTERVECGKLRSVIDRVFPLEATPEAFSYFSNGEVKGKVVIKV